MPIWPMRAGCAIIGRMTEAEIAKLSSWLAKVGLEGRVGDRASLRAFASAPRPRAAAGARDRVHRHPASLYEGRAFRWERDKPEVTIHRLRPQHGRRSRRALADEPLVPHAGRRRICAAPAHRRRGRTSNFRCSARIARGVAHRLRRRPQSLRRRWRDRRNGLLLFGLDDRPAGGFLRRRRSPRSSG